MTILELKPKPIKDYEAKYEIHHNGKVWNKGKHSFKKLSKNPNGYLKTLLAVNGNRKQALIHQLVATHFIANPYNYKQVNHIDGDKTNNHVNNLEWVSNSENIQHSLECGLRSGFMSIDDKRIFIGRVLNGEAVSEIASEIGRHPVSLSKMLRTQAIRDNLETDWTTVMKKRRKDAAIRNLKKIKTITD